MNKPTRRDFLKTFGAATAALAIPACNNASRIVPAVACPHPAASGITRMSIMPSTMSQYYCSFTNKEGLVHGLVPLIENLAGTLMTGEGASNRLVTTEGQDNVGVSDYFVLNKPGTDFTRVFLYGGFGTTPNTLLFYDTEASKGQREVTFDPVTGNADLVASGVTYKINVNPITQKLSVDLDGDGAITPGARSHIVNQYGGILETDDTPEPEPATLRFRIPQEKLCTGLDEVVDIHVKKLGQMITLDVPAQASLTPFVYDAGSGLHVAYTQQYGAKLEWDQNSIPNPLAIVMPNEHK